MWDQNYGVDKINGLKLYFILDNFTIKLVEEYKFKVKYKKQH